MRTLKRRKAIGARTLGGSYWPLKYPAMLGAMSAAVLIGAATVGDAAAQLLSAEDTYEACLDLAGREPRAAMEQAASWLERNGGNPAWHCLAEAKRGVGDHAGAARDFAVLAREIAPFAPDLAVPFTLQAVDAWLIAGEPDPAQELIAQIMGAAGPTTDLWIAAAHVAAAREDWWRAVDALNQALLIDPGSRDAYLLRAAAHRRLGNFELGLDDAERGLQIAPGDAGLLLERGNLRLLSDDPAGAQADWQATVAAAPGSTAAAAAQANLDRLAASQ